MDIDHLSRQTLGDAVLAREVLAMFVTQAEDTMRALREGNANDRLLLAHRLKGSARGVGAFALAECAETLEENPDDAQAIKRIERLIDEVRAFVLVEGPAFGRS